MSSEWVAFACGAVVFGSLGLLVGLCIAAPDGWEDVDGFHYGHRPKPIRRVLVVERRRRDAGARLFEDWSDELEQFGIGSDSRPENIHQRGA